jgi:NAD(P)-dependent dehydrogenase (short-subunit alcohol dehydrogenase family)
MAKVWFITGTSKGFGRIWAEAALQRGDQVVATARNVDTLAALTETYGDAVLTLQLDVTDKPPVDAAVIAAHERLGRLDVVVNNAGYGLFGTIEEVSEEQARAQIETNLFGPLWVTKAALPILREQGSGHIIQVSSIGGVAGVPDRRSLQRLEVGPGGLQPVARRRGRRLRDQRNDRRADRLQHRLERPIRCARRADHRI